MTKKDFKAVARVLDYRKSISNNIECDKVIDGIIEDLSEYFIQNYPNYDDAKFLTRSGYFRDTYSE